MSVKCLGADFGTDWALYHGDCVDVVRQMPDESVGFSVYSPPFANLYTYSDSPLDMGNCADDAEFLRHYGFLVDELHRALLPGRLTAVHCKDLVNYKGRDGMAGLRDFPGEIIRLHERAGFAFHSRVTVWKCPVVEQRRTKAHGLLYKQLRADSTFSRQGLAEYVLVFRKWASEADEARVQPVTHTKSGFPLEQWQRWASPVWADLGMCIAQMDTPPDVEQSAIRAADPGAIRQTHVLNVQEARDDADEKHMCPLQLDLIERCLGLWSNVGDTVLSPFAGIASEGVGSLRAGRKFVGVELKDSYFRTAARNLNAASVQPDMFSPMSGDANKRTA